MIFVIYNLVPIHSVMIVVCTPTKNRRWSWEFSKACMVGQKQKPDMWIVVDNSTSPEYDWSASKDYPGVVYYTVHGEHTVGHLRNICLEYALAAGAESIVFWDDDDYYPPQRISSGVHALLMTPDADIAASSHMYVLLTEENILMEVGPFHEKHGTAGTYTVRRRYAQANRFPDKPKGEEYMFTNEWKANMVQVPAEQTIVVMGHGRNTVDKSQLYKVPTRFQARVIDNINGKMVVRMRWPIPWDLFRSTFVDGEYKRLRELTPAAQTSMAVCPSLRIEDNEGFVGHRV
jgi:glycosyltransferase involved in cell wall biosynthesis